MLRIAAAAALAALAVSPGAALAQNPPQHPTVAADIVPVLGEGALLGGGWGQIAVRIQNHGPRPARGTVEATTEQYGRIAGVGARAPYAVGAGNGVTVRVPVDVVQFGDVQVRVVDESGAEVAARRISTGGEAAVLLVDAAYPSQLRAGLQDATLRPDFQPTVGAFSGGAARLVVGSTSTDPATGDPVLPDRAALWSAAAAVLMRTDVLVRLGGAELEALSGWLMGGGTLALVVARPEDLRHPTLAALVGGEVRVADKPPAELFAKVPLPPIGTGIGKPIANVRGPRDDVNKALVGHAGGNLHASRYGSSAAYGLGEVHLLAFDPTSKPAVDDPWAQLRVLDLVRAAYDRRSSLVFRLGGPASADASNVRRQLDPNESSRWAIAAAALLLCIYALLAGPANFSRASKRHTPLRALWYLPVFAVVAFVSIVAIGVGAKGVRGKARHVTLVEAGAGMPRGVARRFRGFFTPQARELTVRTTDARSVASPALTDSRDAELRAWLELDRDGARLSGIAVLPWQTVVVREDGFADLGDGISLLQEGNEVRVTNRSGRALRGVILKLPAGDPRYFHRIGDGDSVLSDAAKVLGVSPEERDWLAALARSQTQGALELEPLAGEQLGPILDGDARGLAAAWAAVEDTAGRSVDWFPDGVPVLLAQIDGGEGRTRDAGFSLESDRLLVRVVGWGGKP